MTQIFQQKNLIRALLVGAIAMTLPLLLAFVLPEITYANAQKDICISTNGAAAWNESKQTCTPPAGSVTAQSALETTINILSWIVGVAAVIMIIISGFRFVTSGGDANATKSARSGILYAVVGLVVVLLAQAIVWFVLGEASP